MSFYAFGLFSLFHTRTFDFRLGPIVGLGLRANLLHIEGAVGFRVVF